MGGVSSHVVRLHIARYQDAALVRKARDILFPRTGLSDKFVARNQWYAWLVAEPEFGHDYERLVRDLADAGIEATLEDPVKFTFRAPKPADPSLVKRAFRHPDPASIDRAKHYLPYPGVEVDGDRIAVWAARETIDPADLRKKFAAAGIEAALDSHVSFRLKIEGIDCQDCLEDLVEMSGRVKGVAHARLSPAGAFQALIEKEKSEAARKEIRAHIEGYGFAVRLEGDRP